MTVMKTGRYSDLLSTLDVGELGYAYVLVGNAAAMAQYL